MLVLYQPFPVGNLLQRDLFLPVFHRIYQLDDFHYQRILTWWSLSLDHSDLLLRQVLKELIQLRVSASAWKNIWSIDHGSIEVESILVEVECSLEIPHFKWTLPIFISKHNWHYQTILNVACWVFSMVLVLDYLLELFIVLQCCFSCSLPLLPSTLSCDLFTRRNDQIWSVIMSEFVILFNINL